MIIINSRVVVVVASTEKQDGANLCVYAKEIWGGVC